MKLEYAVALLGLVLVCAPSLAQSTEDTSIDAILNASTSSEVVNAYAQATRMGSDLLAANKAYVSKMADLGRPELAFEQATEVARRDPADGLAWAVQAYNYADRQEPYDAFTDLLQAVKSNPNNRFVVRTAGQLLAWFDSDKLDRDTLPDQLRSDVGVLKIRYGDNQTFLAGYEEAARVYAGDVTSNQVPPADVYSYPDNNNDNNDNGYAYAQPYFPDGSAYDQPWWWNPFWGGSDFFFSNGHRHHHHGDRDGDRGGSGNSRFGARGPRGSRGLTGPSASSFVGGTRAGIRSGRNTLNFALTATPPGVRGSGIRGLTTSGGSTPGFSVWRSINTGSRNFTTGGTMNRSAGFSRSSGHWSSRPFSGGSSRTFSSGGSRSFSSGGFRSGGGGGFHGGGGGGFHGGGGGGHGGGGHR
jgi:hypothetical protein